MVHEEFRSFSLEETAEETVVEKRQAEKERKKGRFVARSNARGSEIFSRHLVEETAFSSSSSVE